MEYIFIVALVFVVIGLLLQWIIAHFALTVVIIGVIVGCFGAWDRLNEEWDDHRRRERLAAAKRDAIEREVDLARINTAVLRQSVSDFDSRIDDIMKGK